MSDGFKVSRPGAAGAGGPPSGPAGGELAGTYPNPTVAATHSGSAHHAQLHHTAHEPTGGEAMAVDALAATGSLRTLGTGAAQAAAGNDARLSDARTPTAHAASHTTGADKIATGTPTGALFLRDDFAWVTPVPDISATVLRPAGSEILAANRSAVAVRSYTIASGQKLTIGSAARFRIL